jgi:Leu/Phe-tRNA-protein transferase
VSLIVNHEEYLLRALAVARDSISSRNILEIYSSAAFIETDDSNTTTWYTMDDKIITNKNGSCL